MRWSALLILLLMLTGCGRMLPMGGQDELVKYRVRKGDTLYSIAWRYGYDHREVAAWNHIPPPYNIYPGQQLLLIAPHQRYPKAPPKQTSSASSEAKRDSGNGATSVHKRPPAKSRSSEPARRTAKSSPPVRVEKRETAHTQRGVTWRWPTTGIIVGNFNPGQGKKGLDIRGKLGQAVLAAADGNVVYSGSGLIGYGNLVIVKHNDTYLSAYGHNRRLLVKEGSTVKQGQKIAEMGDSGKDGVILHFEIRRDGKPVNPLQYLPKRRN